MHVYHYEALVRFIKNVWRGQCRCRYPYSHAVIRFCGDDKQQSQMYNTRQKCIAMVGSTEITSF